MCSLCSLSNRLSVMVRIHPSIRYNQALEIAMLRGVQANKFQGNDQSVQHELSVRDCWQQTAVHMCGMQQEPHRQLQEESGCFFGGGGLTPTITPSPLPS